MSIDTVEATTNDEAIEAQVDAPEVEVAEDEATSLIFTPTRSRINPSKPEGEHFTDGVSILFVTQNAEGTKVRALVTDDQDTDIEVGDELEVKRFGTVTVLAVRHADGEVEGELPDANLALRLLG